MDVHSKHSDLTLHRSTVDESEVLRIVAERVAEKAGISLGGDGVSWRGYVSTRDTSIGTKKDVVIEITEDHTKKPQVG